MLYPSSLVARVTKIETICYQKWLTLAQRHEIGKKEAEIGFTLAISQPSRSSESPLCDNSTITFTGRPQPIMLKNLFIMLLSSAQKIAHYAQYYAHKY